MRRAGCRRGTRRVEGRVRVGARARARARIRSCESAGRGQPYLPLVGAHLREHDEEPALAPHGVQEERRGGGVLGERAVLDVLHDAGDVVVLLLVVRRPDVPYCLRGLLLEGRDVHDLCGSGDGRVGLAWMAWVACVEGREGGREGVRVCDSTGGMRTTRRRCVGRGERDVSKVVLHFEEVGSSMGQHKDKDVGQVPGEGPPMHHPRREESAVVGHRAKRD